MDKGKYEIFKVGDKKVISESRWKIKNQLVILENRVLSSLLWILLILGRIM